jgi:hypothetical protein
LPNELIEPNLKQKARRRLNGTFPTRPSFLSPPLPPNAVPTDPCSPDPCTAKGMAGCSVVGSSYACVCGAGYTGANCTECASKYHRNSSQDCVSGGAAGLRGRSSKGPPPAGPCHCPLHAPFVPCPPAKRTLLSAPPHPSPLLPALLRLPEDATCITGHCTNCSVVTGVCNACDLGWHLNASDCVAGVRAGREGT